VNGKYTVAPDLASGKSDSHPMIRNPLDFERNVAIMIEKGKSE
jgi:hypothetical protein